MPKSKYVELVFVDGPEVPKHSLAGYVTCSDYRADGKRHIFMRLPDSEVGPPKRKKKDRKAELRNQWEPGDTPEVK